MAPGDRPGTTYRRGLRSFARWRTSAGLQVGHDPFPERDTNNRTWDNVCVITTAIMTMGLHITQEFGTGQRTLKG